MKERLHQILELTSADDQVAKWFNIFMVTLIAANVAAVVLETVDSIGSEYSIWFYCFEVVSILIFSVEYVLRIWTCTTDAKYPSAIRGRFRYMFTFMALIDLLAILPFYIPMLIAIDLRMLRALRLLRLFRLFKVARYTSAMRILSNVIRRQKEQLFITLIVIGIMLVLVSSLMFYVEKEAQPDAFGSIPQTMWWGIVTLTTVGYGDVFPITPMGKLLGAVVALLGIGLFALPAGFLASGFAEEIQSNQKNRTRCPHCDKEL